MNLVRTVLWVLGKQLCTLQMYYSTARFEEVKELELRQISKRGASIEIHIHKGKQNQTRKLQRCIIHHNSLEYQGKMCPVQRDQLSTHCVLSTHTYNLP